MRYCEKRFVESYYPTIENTFSQTINYKGQTFATEIVDTAGQVKRGKGFMEAHEEAIGEGNGQVRTDQQNDSQQWQSCAVWATKASFLSYL